MANDFWAERDKQVELSDEQKRVCFQTLLRNCGPSEQPEDIKKIKRKAEIAASKTKVNSEKVRLFELALKEIDLATRKAQTKYRQLQAEAALDDPEPFWNYFDEAKLAYDALVIEIESLALKKDDKESITEVLDESSGIGISSRADSAIPVHGRDYMNTREVARYLNVSISTIYHLTANDEIPVKRIGTRLVFQKEAIDAWNPSRI